MHRHVVLRGSQCEPIASYKITRIWSRVLPANVEIHSALLLLVSWATSWFYLCGACTKVANANVSRTCIKLHREHHVVDPTIAVMQLPGSSLDTSMEMLHAAGKMCLYLEQGKVQSDQDSFEKAIARVTDAMPPKDDLFVDDIINSYAAVGARPGVCDALIGHRGTHTGAQWLMDAVAIKFPGYFHQNQPEGAPPGNVHLGFLMYWLALHEQICDKVDELVKDKKSPVILVTGHSLGSGSTTAGLYALAQRYPHAQIHTILFGCPRAGDKQYAAALMAQENVASYVRVVYEDDIVTHLPFDWGMGGYTHVPEPWLHLCAKDSGRPSGWQPPQGVWGDALSWVKRRVTLKSAVENHNFTHLYWPALERWIRENSRP
jgi:predicted lipase